MSEQKPMSVRKSIFHIAMFIFWVSLAIYFAHNIYLWFVHNAEVEKEDARYEAHGCYVSDGGSMYSCPNGLPPSEGEVESPKSQVPETNAKTDPSMPGCAITGWGSAGEAISWSCP